MLVPNSCHICPSSGPDLGFDLSCGSILTRQVLGYMVSHMSEFDEVN